MVSIAERVYLWVHACTGAAICRALELESKFNIFSGIKRKRLNTSNLDT